MSPQNNFSESRNNVNSEKQGKNPSDKKGKINWITLGICFLVAISFWFIVALNKSNYTSWVSVPVELTNFPENYQMNNAFPPSIKVEVEGHGIDLLMSSLRGINDTIRIDFALFSKTGRFNARENLSVLTDGLPEGLKAISAQPAFIELDYQEKYSRKVPILNSLDFKLPETWRIVGDIQFKPDSVFVTGPARELENFPGWPTEKITLHPSAETNTFTVELEDITAFRPGTRQVEVSVKTLPFTEITQKVPVRVQNIPAGVTVRLFPDSVNVEYLVPLDEYDHVLENGIIASVNFTDIKPGKNISLYPKIIFPSTQVEMISMDPPFLDYLLVREK